MVSEGFLINPPECLTLVLHSMLLGFTNRQATPGGGFLTLLIFLGIITLLDNMRRDLVVQWFSM